MIKKICIAAAVVLVSAYLAFGAGAGAAVIDNRDAGFKRAGTWHPASNSIGFFGDDYFYSADGTASWTFEIAAAGDYVLSAQWAQNANHSASVQYSITNGRTTFNTAAVSQKTDGGQFNTLGVYPLLPGTAVVEISWTGGYAVADAVQLLRVDGDARDVVLHFACDPPKGEIDGVQTYRLVDDLQVVVARTPIGELDARADGLYWDIPKAAYVVGADYRFAATFYKGESESGLSNTVGLTIPAISISPPVLKLTSAVLEPENTEK